MTLHAGKKLFTGKNDRIISMYDKNFQAFTGRFVNHTLIIDLGDNQTARVIKRYFTIM